MSEADIFVTIKADVRRLVEALERARHSVNEFSYAIETAQAQMTRADRAAWPHRPLWERVWLTYRRKGW